MHLYPDVDKVAIESLLFGRGLLSGFLPLEIKFSQAISESPSLPYFQLIGISYYKQKSISLLILVQVVILFQYSTLNTLRLFLHLSPWETTNKSSNLRQDLN